MGLRVKDEGGSEGRPVMGRIGVATSPHAKAGRLPSGVGGREPSANRRREQSRYCRRGRNDLCWCCCRHRSHLGSRLCRSNVQVDPKANGATASRKGCRRPAEPTGRISQGRCSMLELHASKGARAVLRGGGAGNSTSLPDYPKAAIVSGSVVGHIRYASPRIARRQAGGDSSTPRAVAHPRAEGRAAEANRQTGRTWSSRRRRRSPARTRSSNWPRIWRRQGINYKRQISIAPRHTGRATTASNESEPIDRHRRRRHSQHHETAR